MVARRADLEALPAHALHAYLSKCGGDQPCSNVSAAESKHRRWASAALRQKRQEQAHTQTPIELYCEGLAQRVCTAVRVCGLTYGSLNWRIGEEFRIEVDRYRPERNSKRDGYAGDNVTVTIHLARTGAIKRGLEIGYLHGAIPIYYDQETGEAWWVRRTRKGVEVRRGYAAHRPTDGVIPQRADGLVWGLGDSLAEARAALYQTDSAALNALRTPRLNKVLRQMRRESGGTT